VLTYVGSCLLIGGGGHKRVDLVEVEKSKNKLVMVCTPYICMPHSILLSPDHYEYHQLHD
jgi:hypothetical protein